MFNCKTYRFTALVILSCKVCLQNCLQGCLVN